MQNMPNGDKNDFSKKQKDTENIYKNKNVQKLKWDIKHKQRCNKNKTVPHNHTMRLKKNMQSDTKSGKISETQSKQKSYLHVLMNHCFIICVLYNRVWTCTKHVCLPGGAPLVSLILLMWLLLLYLLSLLTYMYILCNKERSRAIMRKKKRISASAHRLLLL